VSVPISKLANKRLPLREIAFSSQEQCLKGLRIRAHRVLIWPPFCLVCLRVPVFCGHADFVYADALIVAEKGPKVSRYFDTVVRTAGIDLSVKLRRRCTRTSVNNALFAFRHFLVHSRVPLATKSPRSFIDWPIDDSSRQSNASAIGEAGVRVWCSRRSPKWLAHSPCARFDL